MSHLLAAVALAVATPVLPSASPPQPSPAMFAVRDADTTIYIFGSFHALDGNPDWFAPRIRNAFEQSHELVLETLVPRDPTAPLPARRSFATQSLTTSASFLATTRMAIDAGRSQGMQVANGADMVLRDAADAEGKPVEELETLDSQIAMFERMPAPPTGAPRAGEPVGPSQHESLSATMVALQAAWKRGDHGLFAGMLNQLSRSSPETYKMMFVDRNARWADWIAGRLQTPGVVFVAVGAGHLAGKDSLLVRLAEQGIESERLN